VAADGYVKEERQERPKTAILSLAKKWRRAFLKRLSHVLEFKSWSSLAALLPEVCFDLALLAAEESILTTGTCSYVESCQPYDDGLCSHISHLAHIHRRQATSEVNTFPAYSPRWK
jgi:hypothetical protein